jgi:chemotaxis protein methyltransferase CheR
MTLAQAMPDLAQWDARILATDLDTSMIARAEAGHYPDDALEEVPSGIRQSFFAPSGKGATVSDQIRKMIVFKQLNLLGPWPMKGPFDAIFCRNVMIYFDNPTKATLVSRYAEMLRPGGWLYVGHSETLLDHDGGFASAGRTIYRKKAP